jgi:hypothetical protein
MLSIITGMHPDESVDRAARNAQVDMEEPGTTVVGATQPAGHNRQALTAGHNARTSLDVTAKRDTVIVLAKIRRNSATLSKRASRPR